MAAAACMIGLLGALALAPDSLDAIGRPRALFTATAIPGGRVLVAGGLQNERRPTDCLDDVEIIELGGEGASPRAIGSCRFGGRLLPGRAMHGAAALADGRVVIAGGDFAGSVEVFEPRSGAAGEMRFVGVLPGKSRIGLTATVLADGRVFIAGGATLDKKSSRKTELFDPSSGAISAGPELLEARAFHTATLLEDGRVFLAGGVKRNGTELFDPTTGSLAAGPTLTSARDDHRASRLKDGSVLITGGQDESGRTLATCDRFDPAANEIAAAASLHHDRADHVQLVLADGSVLVLGGESDDGKDHDVVLDSVERFDPVTGKWTLLKPLAIPRDDFDAVLLGDGSVFVIAGQTTGDVVVGSVEVYRVE